MRPTSSSPSCNIHQTRPLPAACQADWRDRRPAALACRDSGFGLVRAAWPPVGLTEDEAYYRLWALAPAMGYLDHPPMAGWMIAFGRWVAATPLSAFVSRHPGLPPGPLRFMADRHPVRSGCRPPRRLDRAGDAAAGRRRRDVTPDTPSVLFWGLAGWALAELYVSRNANWWLGVGAFAGLGLLSKYSNLFVGASILLWLSLLRTNRTWFRCWQLWAGGAVAILLALPVLLWNYSTTGRRSPSSSAVWARGRGDRDLSGELVGGSLALMSPVVAVLAVLGLRKVASLAAAKDPPGALLASGMLPFLAYLLVHSLHDRVQANWMAPLYPSFAVCAALALGALDTTAKPGEAFGRLGRWALGVGLLLSGIIYWHTLYPLVQLPAKGSDQPDAGVARACRRGRARTRGNGRLLDRHVQLRHHRPARVRAQGQGAGDAAQREDSLPPPARPGCRSSEVPRSLRGA